MDGKYTEDFFDSYTPIECPTSIQVFGPSFSGKSVFIMQLLRSRDKMFKDKLTGLMFVYAEWQDIYRELERDIPMIKFSNRLPTQEEIDEFAPANSKDHKLIVFDDIPSLLGDCTYFETFFQIKSHHRYCSVITVHHSLFGKSIRHCSLSAKMIILFNTPRCQLQVRSLATQIHPTRAKYFLSAFYRAVARRFGYLCVNLDPRSDERLHLTSNILPGEGPVIAYQPRN